MTKGYLVEDSRSIPLDKIDVSALRLCQHGIWQPYFEPMRREALVHYLSDSKAGHSDR